ncbi:MAG: hypothetical protein HUJ26_07230 [Planctomycetaceae bacterium]|nr:hypothetical protein [Planctomycetaceae bacterium]
MYDLSRRAFLQGFGGAALSLPFLESLTLGAPAPQVAQRLAFYYVPIGVVRRGFFPGEKDAIIPKFTSSQKEIERDVELPVGLHDLQFTPTMKTLERVKDK